MAEQSKLPDKEKNPSEWYTEIIQRAELADIRYGVKGCLVFQPWSVEAMELMYDYLEKDLKKRGFTFVGPTICYAYMQAAGLVNDHLTKCYRWKEVQG